MVLDDIRVIQVFEQVDFHLHVLEISGAQVLQAHLLDSNGLTGAPVEGAIDAAKGAFAQAVAQLVVLETGDILGGPLCCSISAGSLFTLLAVAGLSAVVGRGRGLLCVAGRAWGQVVRGLRGARVGCPVRRLRGVVRHHGGRSRGVSLVACRLSSGPRPAAVLWLWAAYSRGWLRLCLRLRLRLLAAVVEGGEGGGCGGGSQLWSRIPLRANYYGRGCSRILRAFVVCACASRADVLAGSVADALAVIWRSYAVRVLGIPAANGDGRCDVIAPNGSLLLRREERDGKLCARRLSLQRALEHAGSGGEVGVGESQWCGTELDVPARWAPRHRWSGSGSTGTPPPRPHHKLLLQNPHDMDFTTVRYVLMRNAS